MKKIVFILAVIAGIFMVSCTSRTAATTEDVVTVDSVEVATDSVAADTLAVDSVEVAVAE